jgi:hypothetical protein
MAKPNLVKGAARVGGELPEETRAILGATTKAGRAARAGLGGVLANAGDELRGLWQSLGTPMGAANMASGFMGRFAVPAQVGLEASRDPKALAANPEAALTGALVRSQTPVGLFEQSPGWNQVAQAGRQQLTEALTAPGELFKPGGAGRISKRSAKNLVRMLQGIRQGFYDAPVASTMSFVAPALQAATAHAPVAGIADDAGMVAHHGTPHTFAPTEKNPLGEFDHSKIGSGEGNQAYGWGTYLAENPKVAEKYKKRVGSVYTVDVPDEHVANFLDNDALASSQPRAVTRAYEEFAKQYTPLFPVFDAAGNLTEWGPMLPKDATGKDLYLAMVRKLGSDEAASSYLASRGVYGLKFLDATSTKARSAKPKTRNLVIFDPSITTITGRK